MAVPQLLLDAIRFLLALAAPASLVALVLAGIVVLGFSVSPVAAQQQPQPGAPASDVSNLPKPITDTLDRVNMRNGRDDAHVGQKTAGLAARPRAGRGDDLDRQGALLV